MTAALETTFAVLSRSRNESAVPALIAALESNDDAVYEGAIKALVARRSKMGHLAVLKRWHLLEPYQREFLSEGRGRMSGALRDAVLDDDWQLFQNASELVEKFDEFDLVPTLVTLAENKKSEHAQAATELVMRLVGRLSELVYAPRTQNNHRDPESLRRYVLENLERSVERFRGHERAELIEAFVVLAGPSCGLLNTILHDPLHVCYKTVVKTLANSKSTGVIELLISFLHSENTSLNVLNVIGQRSDEPFVGRLLECASDQLLLKMRRNLSRIISFDWLLTDESEIVRFSEQNQSRCVKLVTFSGMKQGDILKILERALIYGEPAGRLAACESLASITGDHPSQLILGAVWDNDPSVQAAAARQLRDRHLPGTMTILLKLIGSPHEIVREASREALAEFSFEGFLANFDTMNDDDRHNRGAVVRKVDTKTIPCLFEQMKKPSRRARMRAIEMAESMQLIPQVSNGLIELLNDKDHLVRASAADALQLCRTRKVLEALQYATTDRSIAVQNAAKASLEVFSLASTSPAIGGMSPTE